MSIASLRKPRPALLAGVTGLALAGLLLTACDGDSSAQNATSADTSTQIDAVDPTPVEDAAEGEVSGTSAAAVPEGWPAEVLVPAGETVLTNERGKVWDLVIEGIDETELKSLIEEMTAGGFTSPGITDMGSGAWVAELTGPVGVVDYSYETGGAGLPNVRVIFMPKG